MEANPRVRRLDVVRQIMADGIPNAAREAAPALFLSGGDEELAGWSWDQDDNYTTVIHAEPRATGVRANTCLWVLGHPDLSPTLALLAYRSGSAPIVSRPANGGVVHLFPAQTTDASRARVYALWLDTALRRADPGRSNLVGYLNAAIDDPAQAPATPQAQPQEAFALERFMQFCGFNTVDYDAVVARGEALTSARRDEAKETRELANFARYQGIANPRARAWIVEEGAHWRAYVTSATISGAPYRSCSVEMLGVHADRLTALLSARPEMRQLRVDDTQGGVATGYRLRAGPAVNIVHHAPHATNENDAALAIHTLSVIVMGR